MPYLTLTVLALVPLGVLAVGLVCRFCKMQKPNQRGSNVTSEGTVAYELSMDSRYGESTDVTSEQQSDPHDGPRVQNALCNIL